MTDLKSKCPHCGQPLEAPGEMLGQTVNCPACRKSLRLGPPRIGTQPPPAPPPAPEATPDAASNVEGDPLRPCPFCAEQILATAVKCRYCGEMLNRGTTQAHAGGTTSKIAAGLLGIFLGSLGIHKFYLGYSREGVTMLLVSILGGLATCGLASGVMSIIGFIEGIIYLTKPDAEFDATYVQGYKGWF
jgi:TM2 domain-containing membrane protein YozV